MRTEKKKKSYVLLERMYNKIRNFDTQICFNDTPKTTFFHFLACIVYKLIKIHKYGTEFIEIQCVLRKNLVTFCLDIYFK